MSPPSSVALKSDTHATESLNAKVMVDVDGVEEEAMALIAHSVLSSKVMSMLFRDRLQLSDAVRTPTRTLVLNVIGPFFLSSLF